MISKYDMSTTGHRIRYLRKRNMESVESISKALCCSQYTWYRYEKMAYVPLDIIVAVAKRYNVDVNYLLCLTDIEKPLYNDTDDENTMGISVDTWNKLRTINDLAPELISNVEDNISFWYKWVTDSKDIVFDNEGISKRAKKLQEDREVTYTELAKGVGVSMATIRKLLKNEVKWTKKYIEGVAEYFRVDIKTLIGGV